MKKVLIGGSRRLSYLDAEIRQRLDRLIAEQSCVLIGDANGADRAVQEYLGSRRYRHVVVYCTAGVCRNNVAGWEAREVKPPHRTRDFAFFAAKDAAMANDADEGLMLWDGKSSGTVVNVARMIAAGKPVDVYVAREKRLRTVTSRAELQALLAGCDTKERERIRHRITEHAGGYAQPALF